MKIAVHNEDIDGIACAALFLRKYPDAIIRFLSVYEAETSEESYDIIADLPKSKNAIINIDHHETNLRRLIKEKRLTEKDLVDPEAPSAASLVAKFLGLEEDPIAKEIVKIANRADTGLFDEKIIILDKIIKLNVKREDVLRKIAQVLAEKGGAFLKDSWLLKMAKEATEMVKKYNRRIEKIVNGLISKGIKYAIFDAREVPFFIAKDFAQKFARAGGCLGASIYRDPGTQKIRVSFRVGACNIRANKLAEKLGGGGHEKAAGAIIDDVSALIRILIEDIAVNDYLIFIKV